VTPARPRVSGHFLPGSRGALAVVLWEPPPGTDTVAAVLHVPAFGDEMNKSRRMVALQARALASHGIAVAALDPSGTGDSEGEFADAAWEAWCEDVRVAWAWLEAAGPRRVLWGLRLGALLCADAAARATLAPAAVVLWQPVLSGRGFFRQLLRLPAAQRLAGAQGRDQPSHAGQPLEVGGYPLNPALVEAADACSLDSLPFGCPVAWFEATIASPPTLSPAALRVIEGWRAGGAAVSASAVSAPSFWSSQEIAEAPALIAATTASLAALFHVSHQGA